MAWTDITRQQHNRDYTRYPSDLNDEEWAAVEKFIPPPRTGGRPRTTDIREVFNEMDGIPKAVHLHSYRTFHIYENDDLSTISRSTEICESPPTLNLGVVVHIFEIEADGNVYRVSVDGKETKIPNL